MVHQAGSLVEPDRLRFDFTHFEAITPQQLSQVDKLVNDAILEGIPVVTEVLPIEEARRRALWPCSARSTATWSAWWKWAACPWNSAAAPMWITPAKVGPFRIKSEDP